MHKSSLNKRNTLSKKKNTPKKRELAACCVPRIDADPPRRLTRLVYLNLYVYTQRDLFLLREGIAIYSTCIFMCAYVCARACVCTLYRVSFFLQKKDTVCV